MLKKCSKCSENKSVERFSKDRSKSDGLTSACKECNKNRERKRRENGGNFNSQQKLITFKNYGRCCQICNSTNKLQVDHRLSQNVCEPNTASVEENAWILCKSCNIAKGTKILVEIIKDVPKQILGPMLLRDYANSIAQGHFTTVLVTIGSKQFTEVKIK